MCLSAFAVVKSQKEKGIKTFLKWISLGIVLSAGLGSGAYQAWRLPIRQVEAIQNELDEEARLNTQEQTELVNRYRTTLTQSIGTVIEGVGTIATIVGGIVLFLNYQNATRKLKLDTTKAADDQKLAESRLTAERFSQAIEQLGNKDSIHIRLGGIYSLEKISKDSPEEYRTVIAVLSGFIREEAPYGNKYIRDYEAEMKALSAGGYDHFSGGNPHYEMYTDPSDFLPIKCPADIQAALTVICRCENKNRIVGELEKMHDSSKQAHAPKQSCIGIKIDLSETKMSGARLNGGSLIGVDLNMSRFEAADFSHADLRYVDLSHAFLCRSSFLSTNLYKAIMSYAELLHADLEGALLISADLRGANLSSSEFSKADLSNANLSNSKLYSTDFTGANLSGANLNNANLSKTYFTDANLSGANLNNARFHKTDLTDANLTDANLTDADLREARNLKEIQVSSGWLCRTKLPKNMDLDPNRDCQKISASTCD